MKKTMNFRPVIRENYAWWLQKTQHFTRAELEEDFIEPEPFGVSVTLHYKDTPVMEMSVHSYPGKEKDETGHIDIKIKSWSCYTGDIKQIYEKKNIVYKDIFNPIEIRDVDFSKIKYPDHIYKMCPELKDGIYDVKIQLLVHDFLHEPSIKIFFADRKEKKEEKQNPKPTIEFDNVLARKEYQRKSNYLKK